MTSWWLGQQKEMGYTLPCRAACATSGRYGPWVDKVPSIACVSRRDGHRWPETLPSLVASLPRRKLRAASAAMGKSWTARGATSWLPRPGCVSVCRSPNALNHKSSDFTGLLTSQRVSGMTVLRSPSASHLTFSSPDRTVSLLASRELLVGEGAFLWINPTVIW